MIIGEVTGYVRDTVMDHLTDRVHHWSSDRTEDAGFSMSLGPRDEILAHLPDGSTLKLRVIVSVLEVRMP